MFHEGWWVSAGRRLSRNSYGERSEPRDARINRLFGSRGIDLETLAPPAMPLQVGRNLPVAPKSSLHQNFKIALNRIFLENIKFSETVPIGSWDIHSDVKMGTKPEKI